MDKRNLIGLEPLTVNTAAELTTASLAVIPAAFTEQSLLASNQTHCTMAEAAAEMARPPLDLCMTSKNCRKNKRRVITRRGVIWLGQTCNLHCHFCYFLDRIKSQGHPEHPFMSLEKAEEICRTLVQVYGNDAVDIQGGEPTIYPQINELVAYCSKIGLRPTLITNALALANRDRCVALHEAGLCDLLVSVHGQGETFDTIVGVAGAHRKQQQAIENLMELRIPFRFNCVLSKTVLPQLADIARYAVASGARAVNFIAFNPFEDQQKMGRRSSENVPGYTEVAEHLSGALDVLAEAGVEANVRYFPFCMLAERHRKSNYNFQQLPYDSHEWDYASWSWTGMRPQRMKDGATSRPVSLEEVSVPPVPLPAGMRQLAGKARDLLSGNAALLQTAERAARWLGRLAAPADKGCHDGLSPREELYRANARIRARYHCNYRYSPACANCSVKGICDGFHGDYADLFGIDEATPILLDAPVDDPQHYSAAQIKVDEEEECERE